MRWRSLLVVVLVVVAGCSGGSSPTDPAPTDTATTIESTPTTAGTPTEASPTVSPTTEAGTRQPTSTTRVTTSAPPQNPWRSNVVYVAIEHENRTDVPEIYVDAVRNATEFWNDNGVQYSDFEDVEFRVAPDTSSADVRVTVVESLDECGFTIGSSFVGCADSYEAGDVVHGESSVTIEAGYTPASTNATVRHEFGHLLGIGHGEEPMPLMAAEGDTVKRAVTDAVNRSYPWTTQNLTVAIVGTPTEEQRRQIQGALQYFEDGADGLLDDSRPSFSMTEEHRTADIVIEASDNQWACGEEYSGGSCAEYLGYDDDADPEIEYYSRIDITLASTDEDTTAWHTAYWIAVGFGARGDEVPDPIDNEDDNPREDWWK